METPPLSQLEDTPPAGTLAESQMTTHDRVFRWCARADTVPDHVYPHDFLFPPPGGHGTVRSVLCSDPPRSLGPLYVVSKHPPEPIRFAFRPLTGSILVTLRYTVPLKGPVMAWCAMPWGVHENRAVAWAVSITTKDHWVWLTNPKIASRNFSLVADAHYRARLELVEVIWKGGSKILKKLRAAARRRDRRSKRMKV